jgi:CHAD domain-containing protein
VKLGPVHAEIEQEFARRHAEARRRALAALDKGRYHALGDAIDSLLADPPVTELARRPAKRELPRSIRRVYLRVSALYEKAQDLPSGPPRDVALHDTRKATKRLRCAIEARELAVQSHLAGGGFTYSALHCLEAARATDIERVLPSAWNRLRKLKNIAWLKP